MGSELRDIPLHRSLKGVLIDEQALRRRVAALGREIGDYYGEDEPLLVGILTGAFIFMADLARAMEIPLKVEFMAVSSYGDETRSSGQVRILKDLDFPVRGRRVLLVEDIVDTGLTIAYLMDLLRDRQPADLKLAALLVKQRPRAVEIVPDWVGFEIPDEFVVGYGLDVAGQYRNLPFIGIGG